MTNWPFAKPCWRARGRRSGNPSLIEPPCWRRLLRFLQCRLKPEFLRQRERTAQRFDPRRTGRVRERRSSKANAREQAARQFPALVQSPQHARAKRVARARRAGDVFGRELE